MMLPFPILADFAAVFGEGRRFYLTHGHHLDTAAAAVSPGDVILYGHTHLPDFSEREGVYYVNPGSVSIPKNGTPHSYCLLEDGLLTWMDLESGPYDRQRLW